MTPPAVILVRPQLGENIGAAARAMANFGLGDLRIVAPRDGWPSEAAAAMAAGGRGILERASLHATIADAAGDLNHLWATTARMRDMRKPVVAPRDVAQACRTAAAGCGILFGPERSGLDNDEAALAGALVRIPTAAGQASINLAQAVLVLAYEWFLCGESVETEAERTGEAPATVAELEGFFGHLVGELDASGFLRNREQRPVTVRNLRNIFLRAGLVEQEVRTLRGVISSLAAARPRD